MEIILVRHGEPDYSESDEKIGFNNLAPLGATGIEQAHDVSKSELFVNAGIVISSPYTRALHTAAIISQNLDLGLMVDIGFHERLADIKNEIKTREDLQKSFQEYDLCKGIHSNNKSHYWESVEQQIDRLKHSLNKYMTYEKLIIVTHGEVIRRFAAVRLPFCGTVQIEYDSNFRFLGWS